MEMQTKPLQNKIDFAVVFRVNKANPNGDPLNGNMPRRDIHGLGESSDVCVKRKTRDRVLDAGESIFVHSSDGRSLREIAEEGLGKAAFGKGANPEETARAACAKWWDVRAFGQLFAYKGKDDAAGVSIHIRGPVTVTSAFSVEPVQIETLQIVKSVNGEPPKKKGQADDEESAGGRSSDTMGTKYRVDKGVYVFYGAIHPQVAERTGFSDKDAALLKSVLPRIFEGDASSARPAGSMEVLKVFWWNHGCFEGVCSSAKVQKSLTVNPDGACSVDPSVCRGLEPEIIDGF